VNELISNTNIKLVCWLNTLKVLVMPDLLVFLCVLMFALNHNNNNDHNNNNNHNHNNNQ
jgi:hypothetical protein